MFTIITGGGRTGTFLAVTLLSEKHRVRLIENRRDVLARLHRELPTEAIYEGDPTDPQVLELAGIREASVLAAITTNDADNLALCYLARETYNVPRTIARVNNPRTAWLFNQTFHVDVAVNQATILASTIEEEMSLGDMMTLLKLRRGQFSIVEEKIPRGRQSHRHRHQRPEAAGAVRHRGDHPSRRDPDPARDHHAGRGRRGAGRCRPRGRG